jgi:hypothetical protein
MEAILRTAVSQEFYVFPRVRSIETNKNSTVIRAQSLRFQRKRSMRLWRFRVPSDVKVLEQLYGLFRE